MPFDFVWFYLLLQKVFLVLCICIIPAPEIGEGRAGCIGEVQDKVLYSTVVPASKMMMSCRWRGRAASRIYHHLIWGSKPMNYHILGRWTSIDRLFRCSLKGILWLLTHSNSSTSFISSPVLKRKSPLSWNPDRQPAMAPWAGTMTRLKRG
jgi:hypothetical protein